MLRLTNGPLAPWDVISSESKRNGRVEVIETVIRHMEAGMERWGVPVPHSDDEEKTELALSFDDAEFQHGPDGSGRIGGSGPIGGSGGSNGSGSARRMPARRSDADEHSTHEPGSRDPAGPARHHDPLRRDPAARPPRVVRPPARARLHRPVVGRGRRLRRVHAPRPGRRVGAELNLGVAITPAYTRGPALLAQSLASMADAAPGRFFCGLGASSQVIVANWNGLAFENQYRRIAGHAALPAPGLQRREGDRGVRDVQGQGVPAGPDPRAAAAHLPGRAAPRDAAPGRPGGRRRHPQLAQRRGRRHIRGRGREGGRRGAARDRGPDLRAS